MADEPGEPAEPAAEAAARGADSAAAGPSATEPAATKRRPARPPPDVLPPEDGAGVWIIWIGVICVACAVVGIICYFFPPYSLMRMLGLGNDHELTRSMWAEAVAGKTVFIKFYSSWCGHCKRMKPAWDELMVEYKNHSDILVADVECSGAGKSLCDAVGVRGFPTIKYGDPESLQDYRGGRDAKALREFASTKLGPICGPMHLEICSDSQRAQIEEFRALSREERERLIREKAAAVDSIEAAWRKEAEAIQNRYKDAAQKKEAGVKAVKDTGLKLLKQVQRLAAKKAIRSRLRELDEERAAEL